MLIIVYNRPAQSEAHADVITAVTRFTQSHKLSPAFDGTNVTQPLITGFDAPPTYSKAERALLVRL